MENLSNMNILDACCGSRMCHYEKNNPNVLFADIRRENHTLCDGRELKINPMVQCDFRKLPFRDGQFKIVIFDPPHLHKVGKKSWTFKKYGQLPLDWRNCLQEGFAECFRVLSEGGILIFKWSEVQIKTSCILTLTQQKPLVGHRSGKQANTHWITFIKQ